MNIEKILTDPHKCHLSRGDPKAPLLNFVLILYVVVFYVCSMATAATPIDQTTNHLAKATELKCISTLPKTPQMWKQISINGFLLYLPGSKIKNIKKMECGTIAVVGEDFSIYLHDIAKQTDNKPEKTFEEWVQIETTNLSDLEVCKTNLLLLSNIVTKSISDKGVSDIFIVKHKTVNAVVRKYSRRPAEKGSDVFSLQIFSPNGKHYFNANLIGVSDRFVLEFLRGICLKPVQNKILK